VLPLRQGIMNKVPDNVGFIFWREKKKKKKKEEGSIMEGVGGKRGVVLEG
jgi:hypothetical protein